MIYLPALYRDVRSLRLIPARRSHRQDVPHGQPAAQRGAVADVAPTQSAMMVRRHPETGERYLDLLQRGLLP
jgi:hypothetical protein